LFGWAQDAELRFRVFWEFLKLQQNACYARYANYLQLQMLLRVLCMSGENRYLQAYI